MNIHASGYVLKMLNDDLLSNIGHNPKLPLFSCFFFIKKIVTANIALFMHISVSIISSFANPFYLIRNINVRFRRITRFYVCNLPFGNQCCYR